MFTVGNGWERNIVRELDGNWCFCEKPILNHEIEKYIVFNKLFLKILTHKIISLSL